MANKPKIQRKPKGAPVNNADLDAFLGGSATTKEAETATPVATPGKAKRGRPKSNTPRGNFKQSVPMPVLERLDAHLKEQENPMSRNAWIVQAIIEKLNNDT